MDVLNLRCSPMVRSRDLLNQQPFHQPFNGTNENLDDFLERFEERAMRALWTEADRVARVATCLTGAAKRIYDRLLESGEILELGWQDFEDKLRRAFPTSTTNPFKAVAALATIKQRDDENIPNFAIRFEKAAKRANMLNDVDFVTAWCGAVRGPLRQALGIYRMTTEGKQANFEDILEYTTTLEDTLAIHPEEDSALADQGSRKRRHDQLDEEEWDETSSRPPKARPGVGKIHNISSNTTKTENPNPVVDPNQFADVLIQRINHLFSSATPSHQPIDQGQQYGARPVLSVQEHVHHYSVPSMPQPQQRANVDMQAPQHVLSQLPPSQIAVRQPEVHPRREETRSCFICAEVGHLSFNCPRAQIGNPTQRNGGFPVSWRGRGRGDMGGNGDRGFFRGRGNHHRGGRGHHGWKEPHDWRDGDNRVLTGANAIAAIPPMIAQEDFNKMYQQAVSDSSRLQLPPIPPNSTSVGSANAHKMQGN